MLFIDLTLDQTSLQNLHTLLSKEPLIAPDPPKEEPGEHLEESKITFQKSESLQRIGPQEAIRASKRLCIPGSSNQPTDHDVLKVLVGKVSSIIKSDAGETMAELRTSVQ